MWFPLDTFKPAWNTFFRRSILVHRRTKQRTNHLRSGRQAQCSMDILRLTWLPFVFTCCLFIPWVPSRQMQRHDNLPHWAPGHVPNAALEMCRVLLHGFLKTLEPTKIPVWVRYQIVQIHQFLELFAGWNEKNPTGVHLDWHRLYTNPSAKVHTRECCCINTFSDEVGLCDSENDVVIVIVCFFGKQTRVWGEFVCFFSW